MAAPYRRGALSADYGRLLLVMKRPRDAQVMLATGHEQLGLSGRGYDRVLKLARTVADLAGSERVGADHVGIALGLRRRGGR